MTLARLKATGSGRLAARVAIEGWPCEFVTMHAMQKTTADGRERVHGLDIKSIKFGSRTSILEGKLSGESCTLQIKDIHRIPSSYLGRTPAIIGYMRTSTTASATTIPMIDVTEFPSSGVVYCATEAISYTSKTAGATPTLNGATRGLFQSTAQASYTGAGAGLAYPRVTDWPESLEGRRVWIYLYGDGDSAQGDGTLAARGVISGAVSFDGSSWSIPVEHRAQVLSQRMQGEQSIYSVRGYYFPASNPLVIQATWRPATAGPAATSALFISGFYDSLASLASAINTRFASLITAAIAASYPVLSGISTLATVTFADAGDALSITYFTGATQIGLTIYVFNGQVGSNATESFAAFADASGYDCSYLPATSTSYACTVPMTIRAAIFPRALDLNIWADAFTLPVNDDSADFKWLYLNAPIASAGTITIKRAGVSDPLYTSPASISDAGLSRISLSFARAPVPILFDGTETIEITSSAYSGDAIDFVAGLIASSPTTANASANAPFLTSDDIATPTFDPSVATAIDRSWPQPKDATIEDVLAAEVLAMGAMLTESAGQISITPLRSPVPTDAASWNISEADCFGVPRVTRSTDAVVGEVTYFTGYDSSEDDWTGTTFRIRDVGACSPNRASRTVEIKQRSRASVEPSVDAIASACAPYFAMFGTEYQTISVETSLKFIDAKAGDIATITHSLAPDSTGEIGLSSVACLVLGRSVDLGSGKVTLELYRSLSRFAGYAPSWTCTVTALGGTSYSLACSALYGASPQSVLSIGDLLDVYDGDASAPVVNSATVTALSGYTITVTIAGYVASSSAITVASLRNASAYASTSSPARYAFNAAASRLVTFSDTTKPARQIAI